MESKTYKGGERMMKSELDKLKAVNELIDIDLIKLFRILDNLDYRLKKLEKQLK